MTEERLIKFKAQSKEVARLGNVFADAVEKWQKDTEPIREELMKINTTDTELIDLLKDMDKLSERLGM